MKQNLLFFIFRLYGGGAERTVSNLSLALSEQYQITIATYDIEERTYPFAGEHVRIRLPFSKEVSKNGKFTRALRLLVLVYKLWRLKKKCNINVSVSFSEQANIINLLTGRKRTIISVRTTLSEEIKSMPRMKVLSALVRLLYNRAHGIVVPGEGIARDLVNHFGIKQHKIRIISNYVDRDKIQQLSSKSLSDPFLKSLFRHDVLLHVGRITPAKGLWLAFHAYKALKPSYPDLKLVSVGEGESESVFKEKLLDYATQLELKISDLEAGQHPDGGADIFFLGFQNNPYQFMRESRLLIFPSVFEGFPNTILEAMECGLPVVAADCTTGPRAILQPGTSTTEAIMKFEKAAYGILTPALPDSQLDSTIDPVIVEEWKKAISLLLGDNTLRNHYITAARSRVRDYDKTNILNQWYQIMSGESRV